MDIVDSQIHLGPGGISEMVAAMNALGISSALLDEYWAGATGNPSYPTQDGGWRNSSPTSELASWTHPGRFSYVVRVDRRDPELRSVARMARDARFARALRILVGTNRAEIAAFARGEYDDVFAAAAECGLPLFVAIAGNAQLLPRYLQRFREVKVIVDHCGMPPSRQIRLAIAKMEGLPDGEEYWSKFGDVPLHESLEKVLALSAYPNVAIKWAHSSAIFNDPVHPNVSVRAFLRNVLNAFGADRVMWASDYSTLPTGETWAEILFSVVSNPELSKTERELVLGGTARHWLNWNRESSAAEAVRQRAIATEAS